VTNMLLAMFAVFYFVDLYFTLVKDFDSGEAGVSLICTYTNGQQGNTDHVVATCGLTLTGWTFCLRSCLEHLLTLLPVSSRLHTRSRSWSLFGNVQLQCMAAEDISASCNRHSGGSCWNNHSRGGFEVVSSANNLRDVGPHWRRYRPPLNAR
jgi:hypothetical protein